ncbi:hypothetical protein TrispH2_010526 [Trichoplax sp. H2]|nr:hypothetical protein TrispH2_010526 [Trichoplax sp. H2]|eukprot:RDD37544.1 hypothetical protein TrispH2_010526 [Trichoplax sp. H2]
MDKRGEKKKKKTPTQCSNDNCVAAPKSNFTGSNSTEKGIDDAIKSNRMLMADLQWIKAKGKAIKSRFWPSLLANFAFWTTTANGRGWPTLASCWILEVALLHLNSNSSGDKSDLRKEDGRASLALAWPRHGVAETQQSLWSWTDSIAAFASPANGPSGRPIFPPLEKEEIKCNMKKVMEAIRIENTSESIAVSQSGRPVFPPLEKEEIKAIRMDKIEEKDGQYQPPNGNLSTSSRQHYDRSSSNMRKKRKEETTWMDKKEEKKKKKTPTQCSNDNSVAAPKSNFTGSNSTEEGIDDAIKSNRMLMADLQWIKAKGKAIANQFWPSLLANFAFWTWMANAGELLDTGGSAVPFELKQ